MVAGGIDHTGNPVNVVEAYDPETQQWTRVANMRHARSLISSLNCYFFFFLFSSYLFGFSLRLRAYAACVVIDGELVVLGGVGGSNSERLASVEIFSGEMWSLKPNLSLPVSHHHAYEVDGSIFVVGGFVNGTFSPTLSS